MTREQQVACVCLGVMIGSASTILMGLGYVMGRVDGAQQCGMTQVRLLLQERARLERMREGWRPQ